MPPNFIIRIIDDCPGLRFTPHNQTLHADNAFGIAGELFR
jgi:hypothetical protein